MALDRQIARLSKIVVDSKKISFEDAQSYLRSLTLEIVVGRGATSPAAHAAILTAISVGSRTFVGGVRLVGDIDQPMKSALPLIGPTLREAGREVGSSEFPSVARRRIVFGTPTGGDLSDFVSTWWTGWLGGASRNEGKGCDEGENPIGGIIAGALAVGIAFEAERGISKHHAAEVDAWPGENGLEPPAFSDVFLPGALWLLGLGNLGQAFLWALSALPYRQTEDVSIVLQDRDYVSEENWATSVLVRSESYGELKTKIAEAWALRKGFRVRRLDERLRAGDRIDIDDPRVAICSVDKIGVRKYLSDFGFDCIVDAGLGRKASDYDRFRVSVFDAERTSAKHFAGQEDIAVGKAVPDEDAYRQLEAAIGICGTSEIAGASVAAPYVSAVAAAVALARTISVSSGQACVVNEVRRLNSASPRRGPAMLILAPGCVHADKPYVIQYTEPHKK